MATSSVSSEVQASAAEYGIFWQLWPQFDFRAGERNPTGLEVELIGAPRTAEMLDRPAEQKQDISS